MQRPKVRFKGFTDDWEQRKLGEVVERRIEQRQQSDEYPRLAFASGQGVIPLSERKTNNREQLTKDEFTKKYLVTELDDIVYNPANVKYGAIDRNKYGRGLISPIYVTFTTKEIPGFIERIVTSHNFQQRALRFEEGTVTKRQSVNPEDLITLDVLVTTKKEEQKKIASFFDDLDNLITFHQRKYEQTKKLKKYMLQKMFPKEGQTVPEIRFEGFTDAWEKRKLESLCDLFTDGDWIEAKDQSNLGVRLVQTGNVGITQYLDKENNKKWISEEKFEKLHCKEIFQGDILVSRLPEPAGRACIMPDLGTRMITAVDCTIIRTSKDCNSKYLVQYLSTPSYFKIVNSFLGGGTRQRISRGNLSTINIPIPVCLAEQEKIGRYFANLDHLITLHQRKCDELQNIKKFMLQNMFI